MLRLLWVIAVRYIVHHEQARPLAAYLKVGFFKSDFNIVRLQPGNTSEPPLSGVSRSGVKKGARGNSLSVFSHAKAFSPPSFLSAPRQGGPWLLSSKAASI